MASDIDLEALQAQIDLSMAVTNELVASWVPRSLRANARAPDVAAREAEKELQELVRRPPRLGVGATLPESASTSARENAKLKHKLAGKSDAKRRREDGIDGQGSSGSKNAVEAVEGEEESAMRKGSSGSKKTLARQDPFSKPSKTKKAKMVSGDTQAQKHADRSTSPALLEDATPDKTVVHETVNAEGAAQSTEANATAVPPPVTSKKKKKRKKASSSSEPPAAGSSRLNGVLSACSLTTEVPPILNGDAERLESEEKSNSAGNDESVVDNDSWEGFGSEDDAVETTEMDGVPAEQSKAESPAEDFPNGTKVFNMPKAPIGLPLLNLHGPPTSAEDGAPQNPSSSKRKRRRRTKNKNTDKGSQEGNNAS